MTAKPALVIIGRFAPFKALKSGKIHLSCRRCKATRNNMNREEFDPPAAVVMELSYCPKCDTGGEFESVEYYDAEGKVISYE